MNKIEKNTITIISISIVLLILVSLLVGKYPITISDITSLILGRETSAIKEQVFWNLRFSRTLAVVVAGFGLSIAGSVFQVLFRNPLASPDIIGVTSGANLGAAVAVVFFSSSAANLVGVSFVGGLGVIVLMLLLIKLSGSKNTNSYILMGIVIKSVADAGIMTLKYFDDPENELAAIEYWAMGSFSNITMAKLIGVLPFFIVGIMVILLLRRQIFILNISDDEIRTLGLNANHFRFIVLTAATLVVSSIVCITGLIRFIGLISPHIAGLITKRTNMATTVISGLIGSIILLISDTLVRLVPNRVIPISIVTTLIAVPFLVYYIVKRKGSV